MMAEVFARLFHLTGNPAWRGHAEALIRAFSGADRALVAMPTLLAAADLLEDATTVVIAGAPDDPAVAALAAAALPLPTRPSACCARRTRAPSRPSTRPTARPPSEGLPPTSAAPASVAFPSPTRWRCGPRSTAGPRYSGPNQTEESVRFGLLASLWWSDSPDAWEPSVGSDH